MSRSGASLREMLGRVRAFGADKSDHRVRLLEAIAWPREVEEDFFAHHAGRLPSVSYTIDREAIQSRIREIQQVATAVDGDDPVANWLRANLGSLIDANRMVLAVGTREFSHISREIYGSAHTRFRGGSERNIDLATHLIDRLKVHGWDEAQDPEAPTLTAEALADTLAERLAHHYPEMSVEFVVDEHCAAKVVAGMSRVRIRKGAVFQAWEVDGLWHHEVETHVLTAQNGAEQVEVPFLRAGGPRTTRTQEGLAVFAEMHNHTLSVARMERLAERVLLVEMAEQGASFLDLYRHLIGRGCSMREAYFDAQRVCRGGLLTGGAPFTKDACYLAGLLEVNAFLAVVVRGGFRDEVELLASGRIDLDDVHALVLLRQHGILRRPRSIPGWLRRWRMLLPYFAFSSFMNELRLSSAEAHYRELIALAASYNGPPGARDDAPPPARAEELVPSEE